MTYKHYKMKNLQTNTLQNKWDNKFSDEYNNSMLNHETVENPLQTIF